MISWYIIMILLFRLPSDNVQRLYQSCHPPIVYTKRVTINRIMIHSFIISKKQSPFFSSSLRVLVCILSSPTRRRFHPQQSCGQKGRVVTGIYLLNNNSIPGMYVYVCYGAVPPPRPVLTIFLAFIFIFLSRVYTYEGSTSSPFPIALADPFVRLSATADRVTTAVYQVPVVWTTTLYEYTCSQRTHYNLIICIYPGIRYYSGRQCEDR